MEHRYRNPTSFAARVAWIAPLLSILIGTGCGRSQPAFDTQNSPSAPVQASSSPKASERPEVSTPTHSQASSEPAAEPPATAPSLSHQSDQPETSAPQLAAIAPQPEQPQNSQPQPEQRQNSQPQDDESQTSEARDAEIVFEILNTTDPITLMAMTEDGRFLLTSHLTAGKVSIYDVRQEQFIASIETSSPRSILCRGDNVLVANFGEGTISIFSRSQGWQLIDQVEVEEPNIIHMSAAKGEHFNGEVIVTCHGEGRQASYQNAHIYLVDVEKDQDRKIAKEPLASVSYDGRVVLGQASFNLSSSGAVSAYPYADYVREGDGKHEPLFGAAAERGDTDYLFQIHPGSYWLGHHQVFGGGPLKILKNDESQVLIPDLTQRVFYQLSPDQLIAHQFDVRFSEVGDRHVTLPAELGHEFHRISRDLYRRRDYLIDHLVGCTHDETLHLFIIDYQTNTVLKATTAAFATPESKSTATVPTKRSATEEPHGGETSQQLGVPTRIVGGEAMAVQLTGPPGTEYELFAGPQSSRLSADGRLTWTPADDQAGLHRLKIRVARGDYVSFERPEIEVIAKALAERSNGDLANLGLGEQLILDPDHFQITPGQDYQSLLLLQGDRLRRLGPDGLGVREEWKLPDRYRRIAERQDVWVAVHVDPFRLDVIDKVSLGVVEQISLAPQGVRVLDLHDVVIHPRERISYVTVMQHGANIPRYRVLIVDEEIGRVTAPDHLIGKWLAIDPDGRYLYAAYSGSYTRDSVFHINPDWRIIETPRMGSIDWLISYNLHGQRTSVRQVAQDAGGNGQGLRLAPDGQRITYLSAVGYPSHSENLAGFNPVNLDAAPVIYPTSEAGTTKALAYHPTLGLVASPSGNSAALFDRETGKRLEDRLLLPADGLGDTTIDDLWFSPSGRSLVFLCSGAEGRRLINVSLRLSTEDEQRLRTPQPNAERAAERIAVTAVKRSELDSLKPADPSATPMTPQQIAQEFMQSVVRVQSSRSSATGFVVGKEGYILTSAHAVPVEQDIVVTYGLPKGDTVENVSVEAKLAAIDDDRDLALLKISTERPLRPVTLAVDAKPEAGEQVTVIGNPGVGEQVLAQTLTTGVVSSASQTIDGRNYIQTSAAVNPGSSGGPMFDDHGSVIGLMAAKANIEGAGFAISSEALRAFLAEASQVQP